MQFPRDPESLNLEQMAKIAKVGDRFPGFTLISESGNEMIHALSCPNCGHPTVKVYVGYEEPPTAAGWRSVDLKDRVATLTDTKPQLVALDLQALAKN